MTRLAFTLCSNIVFPVEDALAIGQSLQNFCIVLAIHIPGTSPKMPTTLLSHCKAELCLEKHSSVFQRACLCYLFNQHHDNMFEHLHSPGGELSLRWISDLLTCCTKDAAGFHP